ncbi:YjgP/YjgQ family permease, possible lipopolysaccharide transport protein [Aliarcobacter butzleri 7h1h]|uniref:YjgP/YjgQ family permease n=1 Tax=Aliarcobacter butzleri L352 TaxID=1447260 RepID=A0A837JCF6_9BACT|nr:LptF/LptG family permease [Aliarcobacter butzleri]AGR76946.1 YjgP/YjgQ family permease, possible lipopolysaccharide transport protein [Aliarcobacter butzleri 7h1h]KLE04900.1 YjgP/YjgQ family permease [Aliarcobacter butzleri L352]MCG3695911.1 LptF/LptG family permease [Aliarcobacter butzleri]MCG3705753.1 LptF/LptG family permease [Aliarcobacter butzleri]MCG3707713.1 LptF/LptG family permease [Aliarcobacter butzleri]
MSILSKYILKKYLINFIIVLISLELFFVGIDYLQNFKNIPASANLQLLYILYNSFFTLTLALPLSIVFGWIVTLVLFIKNNEFVAFNALGATRKNIFMPVVIVSISLLITLIFLQMTPLAYSYEQKRKILNDEYFSNTKSDIFLKYNEYYVYFQKLLPLEKKAENIHIYKVKGDNLVETIIGEKAYFQNDKWYVVDVKVINKPENIDINNSKLDVRYEKFLHTLEGFKPKILDNVYESKSDFSIMDAVSALILLNDQGMNTQKIRTILYNQLIIPFFVIPILILVYSFASLNSRFFNMAKFVSFSIFGTLIVWGFFFLVFRLTSSGTVIPEISMLLTMFIWVIFSIYFYNKKINS